ncbi:hypothetical protein ACGFQG_20595 [Nocardia fluminea]|uniref:hypothetical protein n=1 Tax=Nocardia fluminea TaxID=134984 RepID=UPI003723EFEA
MMNVDPIELRQLSQLMEEVATTTGGLTVSGPELAMSTVDGAALVSQILGSSPSACEKLWSGFGSRCLQVAAAARGGSDDFEVTDSEFSAALGVVAGEL